MTAVERNDVVAFVAGSLYGESPLSLEDAVAGALRLLDQFDDHGWTVHADREPVDDDMIRVEWDAAVVPKWLTVGGTTYDVVPREGQRLVAGGSDLAVELAERFEERETSIADDEIVSTPVAEPEVDEWPADAVFSREACEQAEQAVDAALRLEVEREPVDTSNDMLVAIRTGDSSIAIQALGPMAIERDKALRMAAWIVALADPLGDDFARVLEAVQST